MCACLVSLDSKRVFESTHGGFQRATPHHTHTNTHTRHQQQRYGRTPTDVSLLIYISLHMSVCLSSLSLSLWISISFCSLSLVGSLFLFSITMTMIARSVGSLRTHGPTLPSRSECVGRSPLFVVRTCSHHVRNILSEDSSASLVPLGMMWACICAGKKNVLGGVWWTVLCVFVRVGMY